MRVYEYAKRYGIKTKELIRILDEIGIVKSAQSTITEEEIRQAQIEDLQEDNPIPITEMDINTKDYYDVKSELIDKYPDCNYYVAYSSRGVGKSTNCLLYMIKQFLKSGDISVLVRRRDEEINGGKFRQVFSEIEAMGYIYSWSQGKYNSVHTIGPKAYLCKRDFETGKIEDKDPNFFCYAVSLNTSMNIKGIQLNRADDANPAFVTTILFDEALPVDNNFLPREDELFFNAISTLIRHYDKCKIILFANTIVTSKSPIFETMGINLYDLRPGEIRVYEYESDTGNDRNKVCVHYVDKGCYHGVSNKNNKYFTFNNQKLNQITGIGDDTYATWELSKSFPAVPRRYKKENLLFTFYWIYGENEVYAGDVIQIPNDCRFIYCHKTNHKLEENWLDTDNELILSTLFNPKKNWVSSLCSSKIKRVQKIRELINQNKVFYQNAWVSYFFQNLIDNL